LEDFFMAKKNVESDQPKVAVADDGSKNLTQKAGEQKSQRSGIVTTEGNTLDKIRIFQKDGATMVQADYGKLNPNGKTPEERRANMRTQISRPLTAEQSAEYQRLSKENPAQAKEYAARTAYPMHVDDAAFHQKDTEINGRHVNYIVLEKLTADKLSDDNKHLAGAWQLSFGEKDNKDSRFFGILNKEELASIRNRAEVTLGKEPSKDKNGAVIRDNKGNVVTHDVVKSIGAPLSMADIAARVEQRVNAQRQATAARLESAQKVDWSKYKFPEGATVTGLHYTPAKDKDGKVMPDNVMLRGTVNGISVSSLLWKNETTAVKNKMATLEQVGAANKDFSQKVHDIVNNSKSVGVSEDAAVKAIIDRASDKTAKSFTPEQRNVLMKFASSADAPEAREKVFDGLWEKAETALKDAGVNEAWQKDAHEELKDLAEGVVRGESQGMKR
jgi:hypothetical protein